MKRKFLRATLLVFCMVPMLATHTIAHAGVIGPEQFLNTIDRRATLDSVNQTLAREEVQRALKRHGVDPAEAAERAAALNDQELVALAENLENLPAGSSLLGTLGVVAIVLLILELVGAIDIFNKI